MGEPSNTRGWIPALSASIPIVVIFVAVLSIMLTSAERLALTERETAGWIVVVYGLPAIPSLMLTLRYRQPLLLTGNVFAVIFLASLGNQFEFRALSGAAFAAGAIVTATAALGATARLATWIPAPVVHGLVAGVATPFVVGVFTGLSNVDATGSTIVARIPIMVGAAIVGYFIGQRFFATRVPPIFLALVAGAMVAATTGQFGPLPGSVGLPRFDWALPAFEATALLSVTPVLVALIVLQSNLPCMIYMREQGYDPPDRAINILSGIGTMAASVVGPATTSLAVPLVTLTAGPTAGKRQLRYRSVFAPAGALVAIALGAGIAADLANLVPPILLLTLAGLALIGVFVGSLREIGRGPLLLGPVLAFAIALSDIRLFELGPFFWSLVGGTAISMFLERDAMKELRRGRDLDLRVSPG